MMTRTLLAVPVLLLAAACGGGGEAPAKATAPAYTDLRDLASALGCSGTYGHDEEPMMFAADTGHCTMPGGSDVTLNLFNNDAARDNYVKTGMQNGGAYVVGKGWLVECRDHGSQAEAAKATKGTAKG